MAEKCMDKSGNLQGWHAKKYANNAGMMHVNVLAKPHPYSFQVDSILESCC